MGNQVLANLEPKNVLRFFEELCALPHGSGNTAAASNWAVAFAKKRRLRHRRDEAGNVVIWKDASPGYEDHPAVMLRGAMRLNCSFSTKVVDFSFVKDGLKLEVDGDWISARDTSLCADDSIGVAMAMAVLDDDTLPHPPLEAVFTTDAMDLGEVCRLEGTAALDCSGLESRRLISIDPRKEGVLTAGCASGVLCDIIVDLNSAVFGEEGHWTLINGCMFQIGLEGPSGEPSGAEMRKGCANLIRLLAECLQELDCPYLGLYLYGGKQGDAIPIPDSVYVDVWAKNPKEAVTLLMKAEAWAEKKKAACPMDPGFILCWRKWTEWGNWRESSPSCKSLSRAESRRLVSLILDAPSGVIAMDPDQPDRVRTSVNLGSAVIDLLTETFRMSFCVYSSEEEEKERMVRQLQEIASAHGAAFICYGWEYRKDSPLWRTMAEVFKEQYGREPEVETIQTGVPCGVLVGKMPGMDAVSFGPDLDRGRASISSIQRTWTYLTAVLARL